eukprot:4539420-Pleurochrysis_carterae.AAC.1
MFIHQQEASTRATYDARASCLCKGWNASGHERHWWKLSVGHGDARTSVRERRVRAVVRSDES